MDGESGELAETEKWEEQEKASRKTETRLTERSRELIPETR